MLLLVIGAFVALLTFGSAMTARHLQQRLPESSKSEHVRGVITQISALVSLLLAMVLGTLVGTSFAFFFTQKTNLDTFAGQILQLDQALAQYGPETKPARAQLKQAVVEGYDEFWGGGDPDSEALSLATPLGQEAGIEADLASLQPVTEAQKQALAKANQYASALEQSRLMMSLQVAGESVPWQVVLILSAWAIALFFGFGLFAPNDVAITTAWAFGALSIGLAIFLIFDLRQPYNGIFRISPAALQEAIAFMDK
jgi:hypothetical protein